MLKKVKDALYAMVPVAHPEEILSVCVYTDASQDHWVDIVTHLAPEGLSKPRAEQNHFPFGVY